MLDASVVVVVLDNVNAYQTKLLAGIRAVLEARQVPVIAYANDVWTRGGMPPLARLLSSGRVRGVIVTILSDIEAQADLSRLLLAAPDLPALYVGLRTPGVTCVSTDNETGMRQLLCHLLDEQGARRIAVVRGPRHHPDSLSRESVVREELARRGLVLDPALVLDGGFDRDISYRLVAGLLRWDAGIDAIVALNDRSALGALEAVAAAGLNVPGDIAVTGFDDDEVARFRRPALTTVDQSLLAQGETAARLILEQIAGSPPGRQVALASHLVVRGSSLRKDPATATAADPGVVREHTRTELAAMDSVLSMSRALMTCRDVAGLMAELATNLSRLGVNRCFVVLARPGSGGAWSGHLALCYRNGVVEAGEAAQPFPSDRLLPDHLEKELTHGLLMMQPLSAGTGELGYVLFEQTHPDRFTGEVLRMDLSRTLEAIQRDGQLAAHAEHLEHVVEQRTQELAAQVLVRTRAETELRRVNAELRQLMRIDGLTRIANRAAFDQYLAELWHQHEQDKRDLSLVMIDVDHFKAFNDRYGHVSGDECLRVVAQCLPEVARKPGDLATRYGGEEFAIVLPHTAIEGAHTVAEHVQTLIHDTAIPHQGSPVARFLTVSIGIATIRPHPGTHPIDLITAADRALYEAKTTGRDRIAGDPTTRS